MEQMQKGSVTFEDKELFYCTGKIPVSDGKAHCYFTDHEKELFEKCIFR